MTIELEDDAEAEVETPIKQAQAAAAAPVQHASMEDPPTSPGNSSTKALSTPAVRFMAKKDGIDINLVPGTGKNGRVSKSDLIAYMEGASKPAKANLIAYTDDAPVNAAPAATETKSSHQSTRPTIAPLTGTTD
jgi:pyruvate/2-oxoglutarate dehydrogenase complex dihydrolipoamide acyltransferase (E2) component